MLRNQGLIHSKKGDLWVSAALYTALGLILITVILSVGMPFIDKIKNRNTLLQTKELLYGMDALIREVDNEGVGSRRPLYVDLQAGEFLIQDEAANEKVLWKFISDDKLGIESGSSVGQSGPIIKEGSLNLQSTKVGQGYEIKIWVEYKDRIDIRSTLKQLSGRYDLVVEHRQSEGNDYVEIREA